MAQHGDYVDTSITLTENYKSRDGNNNPTEIRVKICHNSASSSIFIQEGEKAMCLVTRPSQFSKRTKPTLLKIIQHFYPSRMFTNTNTFCLIQITIYSKSVCFANSCCS